jgi:outer membrane protein OmpA-like peptidoglycan-associated protein
MRPLAAVAFCSACLFATAASAAKDKPGCQDTPLLSRFPGSTLVNCKHSSFDARKMPLQHGSRAVEGEYDNYAYQVERGHSQVEVKRNISNALQAAGYTIDYDEGRNLVVHKDNVWIWGSIQDNYYSLDIVREKAMQQQVVANARDLQNGLNATGHVTANGIFFDTDKADLKPESKAALDEIGKLLKADAGLKLYVVGHTDNQGALAHNMDLSKARAASVVKALEAQYGIPGARLASYGDGPYAPVASNESDDGRAKNRRVELVKQ